MNDKAFRDLRRALDEERKLLQGDDDGCGPRGGRPRKERRMEARQELLPKDRRCPCCGKIKIASKQWVLVEATATTPQRMVCLSCYRTGKRNEDH